MNRLLALTFLSTCLSCALGAATFTVTNLNDAGAGSLRQAINDAVASSTEPNEVVFASSLSNQYPATIALQSPLMNSAIPLSQPLTISGPGQNELTVTKATGTGSFHLVLVVSSDLTVRDLTFADILNESAPGVAADPVFRAQGGSTLTVERCMFRNCVSGSMDNTTGDGAFASGGAMRVTSNGSTLNLTDVDFVDCEVYSGGSTTGLTASASGGAVYTTGTTVNMARVSASGCRATGRDGAMSSAGQRARGGAFSISGPGFDLVQVTVSDCHAFAAGATGGADTQGAQGGGINAGYSTNLSTMSQVTVTDCSANGGAGNGSTKGGQAEGGGIFIASGNADIEFVDLTITGCDCNAGINSTTPSETNAAFGAALSAYGPGNRYITRAYIANCDCASMSPTPVLSAVQGNDGSYVISQTTIANCGGVGIDLFVNCDLDIRQSTIHGNTGNLGGGIYAGGASSVNAVNVTITSNQCANNTEGGGVYVSSGSSANLNHCIVAFNTTAGLTASPDLGGTGTYTGSYNFLRHGDVYYTDGVSNNQVGGTGNLIDPELGPLQDNGGFAPTRSPLSPSSPIVDSGAIFMAGSPTEDQRGAPRHVGGGIPESDIGAVELDANAVSLGVDAGTLDLDSDNPDGSYNVTGGGLAGDVLIFAPSGFVISDSPTGPFASTLTLSPTAGSLNADVYVRFLALQSPTGGDIRHESPTTAVVTKSVAGTILPPSGGGGGGGDDDSGCSTGTGESNWLLWLGLMIGCVVAFRAVRRTA